MLTPHERALKSGLAAARRLAGASVTYSRGATTLTISKAVEGTTRMGTLGHVGEEMVVELVDWMIDAAALTMGPPQVGDTISRNISGTVYTYTVENLEMGLSHWDWSDTGRTQYRIRTRKDGGTAYTVSTPNGFDISGNEMRY